MDLELKRIRELPQTLNPGAIERSVRAFVRACDMNVDNDGFFNQTIQRISAATFLNQPGQDFWLAEAYGEVAGYALASYSVDIDLKPTYWVSQSWVNPLWWGDPIVKKGWKALRERAKDLMCAHLMIISCRNPKAECRWLGEGMEIYATILKQDLGAAWNKEINHGPGSKQIKYTRQHLPDSADARSSCPGTTDTAQ